MWGGAEEVSCGINTAWHGMGEHGEHSVLIGPDPVQGTLNVKKHVLRGCFLTQQAWKVVS